MENNKPGSSTQSATAVALEFLDAMRAENLDPGRVPIADGQFHRFRDPEARVGDRSAWYKFSGTHGVFGSFRRDEKHSWLNGADELSKEERAQLQADAKAAHAQAEAEKERIQTKAAAEAARLWKDANEIVSRSDHSYLVRKQIQAHGIRRLNALILCIPMFDATANEGPPVNLQLIHPLTGKRFLPGGRILGIYYPIAAREDARIICICEGFATGCSIEEATGLPVAVAFSTANLLPLAKALHRKYPKYTLVIAADNDREVEGNPGLTKATEAAKAVRGALAVPEFPAGVSGTDWNDLSCAVAPEAVREQITAAIERAKADRRRPKILIEAGNAPAIVDKAEKALVAKAEELRIFQRSGEVIRIISLSAEDVRRREKRDHVRFEPGTLMFDPLPTFALMETFDRLISWTVARGKDIYPADCPKWVAEKYLARKGSWKLPYLTGIIEAPILLPDGSVLTTPGYHRDTGLFLDSREDWPAIPEKPSWEDARAAVRRLLRPFSEFPFVKPADQGVFLAGIWTALQRRLLESAPLFAFSAHAQRTGKSLLVDSIGILATGRRPAAMAIADKDEAEMRKALTSILREGLLLTNFDNVIRPLDSPDLAKVLTQPFYRDRLLGSNTTGTYPTNIMFTTTGNNFRTKGDLTSRTLQSLLDAGREDPETRTFEIADLPAYLREHRVELVTDALIALHAWHVAGRPKQKVKPWGGFDDWSREIREPLVWLRLDELADPCETREDVAAHDPEREFDGVVLQQWYVIYADRLMTVAAILVDLREHPKATSEFKQALLNVAGEPKDPTEINTRRFGNWCSRVEGRVMSGYRLVRGGKEHQAQQWQVTRPAEDAEISRLAAADAAL